MLHAAFPSCSSLISISCVALGFDDLGLRLSQVCAPLFAAMPKDSERTPICDADVLVQCGLVCAAN
jgi:hypothetical protein